MVVSLIISLVVATLGFSLLKLKFKLNLDPKTPKVRMAFLARGIIGGFSGSMLVIAQSILCPQKMSVLHNTNVIFVVLLGPCFIHEIPSVKTILLVFASFFGIILVVDPQMIAFWVERGEHDTYPFYSYIFALQSGLVSAGLTILLKAFGKIFFLN